MTATNIFFNFVGFRYSPALSYMVGSILQLEEVQAACMMWLLHDQNLLTE